MGYRHYFYAIPKTQIEEIRKCKTNEEFCNWAEKAGYKVDRYDGEPTYMLPSELGMEIYEFGKYVKWAFEMQEKNESMFSSSELEERYEDYRPVICSRDDFITAIDNYRKNIISYLEGLLEEGEEPARTYGLVSDVEDRLERWKNKFGLLPINTELENPRISDSWLYEYAIFELVRKYKTFDWENDCLVLLGW